MGECAFDAVYIAGERTRSRKAVCYYLLRKEASVSVRSHTGNGEIQGTRPIYFAYRRRSIYAVPSVRHLAFRCYYKAVSSPYSDESRRKHGGGRYDKEKTNL